MHAARAKPTRLEARAYGEHNKNTVDVVVKQALASSQICAYVFSLYPCLSDLEISDAACIHFRSLEVGEQGIKVLVELDKPLLHISYLLLGPLRLPLLQSRCILQLGQIVDNPEQKIVL